MSGTKPPDRTFVVLEGFTKYHTSPMYISMIMGTTTMADKTACRFEVDEEFTVRNTGQRSMNGAIYATTDEKKTIFDDGELKALVDFKHLREK